MAKKAKRQSIKVGDVFEVSLKKRKKGYLLLVFLYKHFKGIALVACGKNRKSLEKEGLASCFSIEFIRTAPLRNGSWKLVGNAEIRSDFVPVTVNAFVKYRGDEELEEVKTLGDVPLMSFAGDGAVEDHLERMVAGEEPKKMDQLSIRGWELLLAQYQNQESE